MHTVNSCSQMQAGTAASGRAACRRAWTAVLCLCHHVAQGDGGTGRVQGSTVAITKLT